MTVDGEKQLREELSELKSLKRPQISQATKKQGKKVISKKMLNTMLPAATGY